MREAEIAIVADSIKEMSQAQIANRWREQLLGYREVLVAELDGAIVGTVSMGVVGGSEPTMHLFALEVAPEQRNRGIGSSIIDHVISEAQQRDCRSVYLEVRVDNPARRLYHRLGFRRVGPSFVNAWYQFNQDGTRTRIEEPSIRMVKRLASNKHPATRSKTKS